MTVGCDMKLSSPGRSGITRPEEPAKHIQTIYGRSSNKKEDETMNSKAIAIIVAISMVVVTMSGALMMGQSDAVADQDEIYRNGTIQVVSGNDATRELRVNEQEFAGYAYTLTWKAVGLTSSSDSPSGATWNTTLFTNSRSMVDGALTTQPDEEDSLSLSGFIVDIGRETTDPTGAYTLTVSANSATSPQYLGLQCEITVQMGGTSRTLAHVYYVYTLTQVPAATNTIQLNEMNMVEDTVFGESVSESTGGDYQPLLGSISSYYWYATELPAGISMSETGYVSGVPLVATGEDPVVANVVATNRTTGETYRGTLSITVAPYEETVEGYTFTLAIEGTTEDVTNGSSFAAVQNESVVLTVHSTGEDTLVDATSVTVVNSNGIVGTITSDPTGTYTIPSNGTGAYRVVVTVGGETIGFYLFVTPSLDNISAGIHVEGN